MSQWAKTHLYKNWSCKAVPKLFLKRHQFSKNIEIREYYRPHHVQIVCREKYLLINYLISCFCYVLLTGLFLHDKKTFIWKCYSKTAYTSCSWNNRQAEKFFSPPSLETTALLTTAYFSLFMHQRATAEIKDSTPSRPTVWELLESDSCLYLWWWCDE